MHVEQEAGTVTEVVQNCSTGPGIGPGVVGVVRSAVVYDGEPGGRKTGGHGVAHRQDAPVAVDGVGPVGRDVRFVGVSVVDDDHPSRGAQRHGGRFQPGGGCAGTRAGARGYHVHGLSQIPPDPDYAVPAVGGVDEDITRRQRQGGAEQDAARLVHQGEETFLSFPVAETSQQGGEQPRPVRAR